MTVLVPAQQLFQDCLTVEYGRENGRALVLVDIGNNQFGEPMPTRFSFAIAKHPLRASVPGLDHKVGSQANDGIVRCPNDRG